MEALAMSKKVAPRRVTLADLSLLQLLKLIDESLHGIGVLRAQIEHDADVNAARALLTKLSALGPLPLLPPMTTARGSKSNRAMRVAAFIDMAANLAGIGADEDLARHQKFQAEVIASYEARHGRTPKLMPQSYCPLTARELASGLLRDAAYLFGLAGDVDALAKQIERHERHGSRDAEVLAQLALDACGVSGKDWIKRGAERRDRRVKLK